MSTVAKSKVVVLPEERGDPLEYLSASRLKSYLTCPLRFYFEKVLALPKPTGAAAHLGKAVHAGIAVYHTALWRGGDASADNAASRYSAEFNKMEQSSPVKWDDDGERLETLLCGDRLIRAYIADEAQRPQAKPEGVEVSLEADVPGLPLPLVGVADLVRAGNRLTDFKTTGVTPNATLEAWQHEIQLTAYDLLIEATTGKPVAESELVFLVKTKTPKVIRQSLPAPDATQRARFKALAEVYVRGVEARAYHPCPGQHCSWCQYRFECSRWKGGVA